MKWTSVCEWVSSRESSRINIYILVSWSGKHSDAVSQNFVFQNLTLTTNVFEDYCSTENFNKKSKYLWVQY